MTSVPGLNIYITGDLSSVVQGSIVALVLIAFACTSFQNQLSTILALCCTIEVCSLSVHNVHVHLHVVHVVRNVYISPTPGQDQDTVWQRC